MGIIYIPARCLWGEEVISIINYGVGNVAAFRSAYQKLGIASEEVNKPSDLKNPTHIILPGVGSFEVAIDKLNSSGFVGPLRNLVIQKKINILGVCVGFQMMGKSSEEMPSKKGLGWIDAKTVKMVNKDEGVKLNLPHMGWNSIIRKLECPLLDGIESNDFYFLHSYNVKINGQDGVSSICNYDGEFTASASIGNIFGTQFHPEKSHSQGLRLLKNFALT